MLEVPTKMNAKIRKINARYAIGLPMPELDFLGFADFARHSTL